MPQNEATRLSGRRTAALVLVAVTLGWAGCTTVQPWQRARLAITGRMVCIGVSSAVKNGKRNLFRVASTLLKTPRISILRLFNANTGIYALNALHVLRDPTWTTKLTRSLSTIHDLGITPHIGKTFPATDVASAHAFLETKQATGKVLLQW